MGGRELVIRRTLDAPRDLVWMAFSDPGHAKRPMIAGFGERFETTPAGGHGLPQSRSVR